MIKIIPPSSIILRDRPFIELSLEQLEKKIDSAILLLNKAELVESLDAQEALIDKAETIAKAVRVELINRN